MVCKLKKNLYGLMQAPWQWYKKFDTFTEGYGYKNFVSDHHVMIKKFGNDDFIILLFYVYDLVIVG